MAKIKFSISCLVFILGAIFAPNCFAQKTEKPSLTWDLGVSSGSYNTLSYSEIDVGLNWYMTDYLNWRNAFFTRSGVDYISASGLDSSLRFEFGERSDDGSLGIRFFAGGGARISNAQYSGLLGEGGLTFKIGGLNAGVGVKAITYSTPGKDPVSGLLLPNSDVSYFIILSGAGVL